MICKFCGTALKEGTLTCPHCGTINQTAGGNGFWDLTRKKPLETEQVRKVSAGLEPEPAKQAAPLKKSRTYYRNNTRLCALIGLAVSIICLIMLLVTADSVRRIRKELTDGVDSLQTRMSTMLTRLDQIEEQSEKAGGDPMHDNEAPVPEQSTDQKETGDMGIASEEDGMPGDTEDPMEIICVPGDVTLPLPEGQEHIFRFEIRGAGVTAFVWERETAGGEWRPMDAGDYEKFGLLLEEETNEGWTMLVPGPDGLNRENDGSYSVVQFRYRCKAITTQGIVIAEGSLAGEKQENGISEDEGRRNG